LPPRKNSPSFASLLIFVPTPRTFLVRLARFIFSSLEEEEFDELDEEPLLEDELELDPDELEPEDEDLDFRFFTDGALFLPVPCFLDASFFFFFFLSSEELVPEDDEDDEDFVRFPDGGFLPPIYLVFDFRFSLDDDEEEFYLFFY
jgi:hypothetical protein